MMYQLDPTSILQTIDTRCSDFMKDCNEYNGDLGNQHYKLLSYLSTLFNNSTIIDIGTHMGSSALALSYNPSNTVYTFDISDKVSRLPIRTKSNITFSLDNLFEPAGQATWEATILSAPFIFMDVDPHNGCMEFEFYKYLKRIGYKGFLVCDDIWYFKEMRDNFWYKIPYSERYDITHLGHWSGTGVISFSPDIKFAKPNNNNWTLVTAYFDLTKCHDASDEIRARDSSHYFNHAISTMTLPYNLVVYCEAENVERLKALRPAYLESKTRFVVTSFDSLSFEKKGVQLKETFADYRSKIITNRRNNPYAFDNRNTASYYLFCISRYLALKEVIEENPFGSTHFAWINMCIERMGYKNVMHLDEALSVKRDKFSTCYIDYVPEAIVKNTPEYFTHGRCSMCSGFFTGNAEYMYKVCDKIEDKFLEFLAAGYGHADEQLYSPVYFENKDLFEHYYGDYQQMITNYVHIYEAAEPPIYNFVRNSYAFGDREKCKEACDFIIRSLNLGKCSCDPGLLTELLNYRRLLAL